MTSTGKKLIQARLPFKILPAGGAETDSSTKISTATSTFTTTTERANALKKRKLEFNDDIDPKIKRKSISKSNVKENFSEKRDSGGVSPLEVVSIDASSDEEISKTQKNAEGASPSASNAIKRITKGSNKGINNTESDCSIELKTSKAKNNKLKIKFPFTDKKKRNRRNDSSTSRESEDGESATNPLKKIKKDEDVNNIRKENSSTPSSVIELISDDEEPIDDSDDAGDLYEVDDVAIEKNDEKSDNNDAKEDDTCQASNEIANSSKNDSVFKVAHKDGANQVESQEIISTEVEECENNEDSKNDIKESHELSNRIENKESFVENILVEDDESKYSKQPISSRGSESTNGSTIIKKSTVRISKEEFKKLMKKSINSTTNKKEVDIINDEQPVDSSQINKDRDDVQSAVSMDSDDKNNESITVNLGEGSSKSVEKNKEIMGESVSCEKDSKKIETIESAENASPKSNSALKAKASPKLTPARLKKLQEAEKRRLKAKEEREKKIQEEKEQKRREKEEKELQRKKEKEEKEEQKRKEKEEREKKRLAEIEAKNEERRQKEEERRRKEEIKEEERRKKEEEKRKKEQEKEEAENKKKRAAEAFTKFFLQQSKPSAQPQNENENSSDATSTEQNCPKFMPFQIKGHMKLAPLSRRVFNNKDKLNLDKIIVDKEQISTSTENLYLSVLKSGRYTPGRYSRTYPKEDDSNDVVVIEDELEGVGQIIDETIKPQKYRAKFLYFSENQRPPYYGTWRKKSTTVKPRRPFATDTQLFDYEVDSDEEWEEEEPGESLSGSDDEKDKESDDEYEVDNEFFVPHGHLSEEEMNAEEEEDNSPEAQKVKLKLRQQEFDQEMSKKTEKIKPILVGIVWQDENGNKPESCPDKIWVSLMKRAMIFIDSPLIEEPEKPHKQQQEDESSKVGEQKQQKQKPKLPEELVKDLIRLFHGNTHKKEFLITEFQAYIAKQHESNQDETEPIIEHYAKATIRKKIEKMAEWTILKNNEKKSKKKLCWIVSEEYLKKYNLEGLSVQNNWSYILEPKKRFSVKIEDEITVTTETKVESDNVETAKSENESRKDEKKSFASITKFTKVLTKEEKEYQLKNLTLSSKDQPPDNVKVDKNKIQEESSNILKEKQKESEKVINFGNVSFNSSSSSLPPPPSPSLTNQLKPATKKRVPLLMSVGRGEQFSQEHKEKLISDFLQKNKTTNNSNAEGEVIKDDKNVSSSSKKNKEDSCSEIRPMEVDDGVIVIN